MKQVATWLGILGGSTLFLWGVVYFSNSYLSAKKNAAHADAQIMRKCSGGNGQGYIATIKDERVAPLRTEAKICDQLTIVNKDNHTRLIAFGQHDHHIAYDGTEEKLLAQNQSFTITLNQTGEYIFHDHDDDTVRGTFVVSAE